MTYKRLTLAGIYQERVAHRLAEGMRPTQGPIVERPVRMVDRGFTSYVKKKLRWATYIDRESRSLIARRMAAGAPLGEIADMVHFANALHHINTLGDLAGGITIYGAERLFEPFSNSRTPTPAHPSLKTSFLSECTSHHPLADTVLECEIHLRRGINPFIEGVLPLWEINMLSGPPSGGGEIVRYSSLTALSLLAPYGIGIPSAWPFALVGGRVRWRKMIEEMSEGRRVIGVPLEETPSNDIPEHPFYFTNHDMTHFFMGAFREPYWLFRGAAHFVLNLRAQEKGLIPFSREGRLSPRLDHAERAIADMEGFNFDNFLQMVNGIIETLHPSELPNEARELLRKAIEDYRRAISTFVDDTDSDKFRRHEEFFDGLQQTLS